MDILIRPSAPAEPGGAAAQAALPDQNPSGEGRQLREPPVAERPALRRRKQRIALIHEFGGHLANLKQVALEAIKRGMYSPRTNRGDVELCLLRTWKLRNRTYNR